MKNIPFGRMGSPFQEKFGSPPNGEKLWRWILKRQKNFQRSSDLSPTTFDILDTKFYD